jgi:hypothetical protein
MKLAQSTKDGKVTPNTPRFWARVAQLPRHESQVFSLMYMFLNTYIGASGDTWVKPRLPPTSPSPKN